MESIFITGATGFIGQALIIKLAKDNPNYKIYATARRKENPFKNLGIEYTSLDLSSATSKDISSIIKDAKHIILLGACQMGEANLFPERAHDVTVAGTKKILNAINNKESNAKNIILFSTAAITGYGEKRTNKKTTNLPIDNYVLTKYLQENSVEVFCTAKDLNFTIFRLQNAYGPGQQGGVVPLFIKKAIRGEDITVSGHPEDGRDFIYIRDVIDAITRAIEKPANKILHLGTGELTTITQLAETIRKNFNDNIKIHHNYDPQNKYRRDFADRSELENAYAKTSFTPLKEGLTRTHAYWKNQLNRP